MKLSVLLALPLALAALASSAGAQELPARFVTVGVGVSRIDEEETGVSATRPHLRLGVGWRIGRGVAVMLDGAAYGIGDDEPRESDFVDGEFVRRAKVLGTQTLFAAVHVEADGFYIRPGLGLGRHAYPAYYVGPGDAVLDAYTGHEAGPAAGVVVGRAFRFGDGMEMGVEGVGVWSHGEDSTGSHWVYGVQVAPRFRF